MKKLIVKLSLLLITYLFSDLMIGQFLDILLKNVSSGKYFETKYVMEKCDANIVIFGSCEAETDIVPQIIEDSLNKTCYNTATPGQTIQHLLCLEKSITNRYAPEIAILVVNEDFLSAQYNDYEVGYLRPFYSSHKEIRPIIDKISSYERFFNYSSLYAYNSSFYYLLKPFIKKDEDSNIKIANKGWEPSEEIIEMDSEPITINNFSKLNYQTVSLFDEFTSDLTSKGCKVFVVIPPIFNKNVNNSSSIEYIKTKKSIHLLDYKDNIIFTENSHFYSSYQYLTDLNIEGATKFTNLILTKIKKLIDN